MKEEHLGIKRGSASQKRGAKGESKAVSYLRLHGYRILSRNYLSGHREVDIIARKGDTVAFIEVKARTDTTGMSPMMSVTAAKRQKIISAAKAYSLKNGLNNCCLRFDIIEVDLSKRLPFSGISHIINAF